MKKTVLLLAAVLLQTLTFVHHLQAQHIPKAVRSNNTVIQGLCKEVKPNGWLYFKDNVAIDPNQFFVTYAADMGLGSNDSMGIVKEWASTDGWKHIKFRQYHQSVPIHGGEYTMHLQNCKVKLAHGKIVEELNINLAAVISEADALQIALDAIDANEYAWQDPEWELEIQEDENDPNVSWYPITELTVFGKSGDEMISSNFNLAYRFEILAIDPYSNREVYVNARTGQVLRNRETGMDADGTASTLYNGTRTIQTKERWLQNDFILKDETRGEQIWTKNFTGKNWRLTSNVSDDNNSWGAASSIPTSGHWAAAQSWDYFLNTWDRNGPDGGGNELRIFTNWDVNNAVWDGIGRKDGIWIGKNGTTMNSFASLDVVGHEFTHGVTEATADLEYERESGALNESFSDIFGTMVERFVLGNAGFNWTIGEDPGGGAVGALRSMENPSFFFQPDTWMGTLWVPTDEISCPDPDAVNDQCGVHTNSGVQNRWFNLLAAGGSLNGINVIGIGADNTSLIAYENLTNFLQQFSNYQDAREGSINITANTFGACSNEVIQTTNAWAAVGVGGTMVPCTSISITGDFIVCINAPDFPYIFTATGSPGGGNFTWSGIPGSWNVTVSGANNSVLTVNSISPMPNSPTNVTLNANYSLGGSGHILVEFKTNSCHPLNDPCDEEDGLIANSNKGKVTAKPAHKSHASTMLNAGKSIFLFPNPASQLLHIQISPAFEENISVELKDLSGKLVLGGDLKTRSEAIFIGDLPSGFYVLHSTSNQINETHSVLIIH